MSFNLPDMPNGTQVPWEEPDQDEPEIGDCPSCDSDLRMCRVDQMRYCPKCGWEEYDEES